MSWLGHRSDMRELYAVADLVLALSTTPEAFGRIAVEALAIGKPVLGYDHGGIGEILRQIYPAGLAPANSTNALLERAMALLLNGDVDGALAVWRQSDGAPSASRVAAIILCEVLAGGAVTPVAPALVPEVSREFLSWYRRLLSLNAGRLVEVLHERLERLRPVLPAVVQMIGDAVNEANAVPVK